ncbi:hypothetical protein [Pseudanabaena sp. FACHB-2040]|uniref:hypothetical protein n=1 Tax=Pseudanabaena sp. FACHB-2040 TaxID=2692859 RepID=UPI0016887F7F|nr:hypothetical protein [Pseudanabaena sp. FACHB-2040]MBD2259110.1 hypothetical protein [Pseudanabaena sp. FACHB-2040]
MTTPTSQSNYFQRISEFRSRNRQHLPAELWDEPVSQNREALRSQQHIQSLRQLHQTHYLERRSF